MFLSVMIIIIFPQEFLLNKGHEQDFHNKAEKIAISKICFWYDTGEIFGRSLAVFFIFIILKLLATKSSYLKVIGL